MGPDPELDTNWYETQPKMLNPDPDLMNPDPESMNPDTKHCF
jgi:hypothetical protein